MNFVKALLACMLVGLLFVARGASADSVPELLHYRFDGTGTSVPNLASSPPANTASATLMGGLTQTGTDLNTLGLGHSLLGTGSASTTDYLDTGWAPTLVGSWTISFITENIGPSSTLFYIFGEANANSFRCFTNGVAGPNNWILRGGGINDVVVFGSATVARHRTTFVYDQPNNIIHGYLDGVLVNSVAQPAVQVVGPGPFKVGGYGSNFGLPAGGLLDDFRLYDRPLSADEVAAIDTHALLALSGNGQPIAAGDDTPDAADDTDFGTIDVGNDALHTFTAENVGDADLVIDSIVLAGAAAADFEVVDAPTDPIPPGASATFSLRFTPLTAGLRAATVTVASNAGIDPSFVFSVQGTGGGPLIALSGAGEPIDNGDTTPSALDGTDFGAVPIAAGPVEHLFVVTNPGTLPLQITGATLGGATPGDFNVVVPAAPIAPGGSAQLSVQFDPSLTGVRSATVALASNALDHPAFLFDVAGTGTSPEIAISGNAVPIANGDTTPEVDDNTHFGAAIINSPSFVHNFVISNPGSATLAVQGVTITGAAATDFAIVQAPAGTVAPAGFTDLTISFAPQADGARRVTVTVLSDAPDAAIYTFDIEGTGFGADMQVSKSNFQSHVQSGIETVYTIQVLNAGPAMVSAVRIVDQVPANLQQSAWVCTSVPAGLCPAASGGPNIDETTGPLVPDALLEYTLIGTPTGVPSEFISNTATVENLDDSDPDTSNNTATDIDPIVPAGIFSDGFESTGAGLLRPRIGG